MLKRVKVTKTTVLQTAKIAIGSSAAIWIAELLNLQFATSAGTIALLTIVTTKWGTLRLAWQRIITYAISVVLAYLTLQVVGSGDWIGYGIYIFLVVLLAEMFGWKATISVNSVIGAHFVTTMDFSPAFILNEFLLVVIGITIAMVLNLFHHNRSRRSVIIQNMRTVESELQMILGEMAAYLMNKKMQRNVWEDLHALEEKLESCITDANEYQGNTFVSHPGYYIDYFEMRMRQCVVLYSLHDEMKKMRKLPKQAQVIAEYILYMADYVVEQNVPEEQLARLDAIVGEMRQEPLPQSHEEFENQALLYHVLMDLEEFLMFKKLFVTGLDDVQKERYWT